MADNKKIIELCNVTKEYDGKAVVKNVSFSIKKGEFVTFLGPSGCGKTTTLRMIAGFEIPTSGKILFEGEDITKIPPHCRKVNTVFQKYALFPHLNVFNNIAFGLKLKAVPTGEFVTDKKGNRYEKMRKYTKQEIAAKVNDALKMVDLEDYGHRNVNSLSGGQQQRVAIARALVNEPEILLLDEPLGALDLKMRKDMQIELMNMHKKIGITFIYVTHDQEEALTMSDRVAVMRAGEILQLGTPEDIYNEPQSAFVADFIGESNILPGTMVRDKLVRFLNCEFACVDSGFGEQAEVDVVVRPEDLKLRPMDDPAEGVPQGVVESLLFKGVHYEMKVRFGESVLLVHSTHARPVGMRVKLAVAPSDIQVMRKSDCSPDVLKRHAERAQ